jgi:cytochrome c oxidase subunit 1
MGAVSSLFAGFFYWIPKITSYFYNFFLSDLMFFVFFFWCKYNFFSYAFFRIFWYA